MTAFIMQAGKKYAKIGGIIVQALTLVISISEQFAKNKNDGSAKQRSDHDPEDGA